MTYDISTALIFYRMNGLRSESPTIETISEAKKVLEALAAIPTEDILRELQQMPISNKFSSYNIPQFSSLDDCFNSIDKLIRSGLDGINFARMGYLLRTNKRKKGADCKYGENHAKCAELMGLCRINNGIWRNSYSYAYESLDDYSKEKIKPKLCLGIDLIRGFFANHMSDEYIKEAFSCLSESTRIRRRPNIKKIIETVKKDLA